MKLFLIILFLMTSCNVIQTITDGETDVSDAFFEGSCSGCATLSESLVMYHRFESFTGSGFTDDIDGNNFIAVSAANESQSLTDGYRGRAANCNLRSAGSADNNNLSANMDFGASNNFTAAFFAKLNSLPAGNSGVFFHIATTGGNIEFSIPTGTNSLVASLNGNTENISGVLSASWNHFTFRVDRGLGVSICINGSCSDFINAPDAGTFDNSIMYFCYDGGSSSVVDGGIDSLGFWRRLLNDDEVRALSHSDNPLEN